MKVVLDAGAFIAVDRRDRNIGAMLMLLQREHIPLVTSGAVVAQVWRDGSRQVNLARILTGVKVEPLDATVGKRIGGLLARSGTSDIVDGHVAQLADSGDRIITSDQGDLRALVIARGAVISVVGV